MDILRFFQSIRTPFWDEVVNAVTQLGDETAFMLVGMLLLWCLNKKWGYRMLLAGLAGTTLNQLLKAIFLIPRPWVIDPTFTIVESAREAATGYSFPSGHTQSVATVFGMLAAWARKRWATVACVVVIAAVAISRMYLGVHTPWDVLVSLITGVLTVIGMLWIFDKCEGNAKAQARVMLAVLAFAVLTLCYVLFWPAREANIPAFDADGVKHCYTLAGTMAGLLLAWWMDVRFVKYDVKACWWAQCLKFVLGAALVMAVRLGMKPVLEAVFGDAAFTSAIRYFLMAVVGCGLYPMTFVFFGRLGKKKAESVEA